MTTIRPRLFELALSSALVLTVAVASAGKQDAETLFAEGRQLRLRGDCAGAILRFRQALEAHPEGIGSLRNIAECEQMLGRYASARRSWWDLRREALQSDDDAYAGWAKHAEEAHASLEAKVPRVTIKLVGGKLDGVRVMIDDKVLPARLIGVPVERDIGEHHIEVWYGGPTPFERNLDLVESAREVVTFTLPTPSGSKTSPPALPPDRQDGSRAILRTGGYVALGLGGLGAIGFGVALGIRQAALDDVESICGPHYEEVTCPPETADPVDRGEIASVLVNVFGAIGASGLVGGAVLVIVGTAGDDTQAAESARIELAPRPGGGVLEATVTF
jgi:hypothetical protein